MATCLKNNRIYIGGVASAPTTNVAAGDLYYNSDEDVLYRRDGNSTWVEIGSGSGITISPTEINVSVGRDKGKGWFDTTRGGLYIWDEQSWIEILDPESASKTYISNTEPAADGQGDYWYKSNSAELYIWDGGTWRLVAGDPTALDELDELIDITNTGTNGQVLQANGDDTFTFVDRVSTLAGLSDITNATSTTTDFAIQANGNGTFSFVDRVREFDDLGDVQFTTTAGQILVSRGPNTPQYGFITHEHTLEDLTDIPSGSSTTGEVLSYSHSTGDFRFIAPSSNAAYGATAPSNPVVGQLWFDTGDSNTPTEDSVGLFVWDGYSWISCGSPLSLGGASGVTIDSSAAGAATINGFTAFQEIKTSDYISDGETFEIPSDVWVWSDDISVAALVVDTPNATVVNNGKIIGKGGRGQGNSQSLQAGGPAIQVTAAGVTIDNASGAYIAGGGGGGGGSTLAPGGGGAGGGQGGDRRNAAAGGVGGTINQAGGNGTGWSTAYGGGAGGGGGYADESSSGNQYGYSAGGGGRILPGVGGEHVGGRSGLLPPVGVGGSAGNAGTNGGSQGNGQRGAGGGGWGAAGGTRVYTGGAGGAAVSGSYTQGTWDGTVYGSS